MFLCSCQHLLWCF